MEFIFVAILNLNPVWFPNVIIVVVVCMLGKRLLWDVIKIALLPKEVTNTYNWNSYLLLLFLLFYLKVEEIQLRQRAFINSCNSEQLLLRETNNIVFLSVPIILYVVSLTLYEVRRGNKMASSQLQVCISTV